MIAAIPTSQRPEMCQSIANQLSMFEKVYLYINNCNFEEYAGLEFNENVVLIDESQIRGSGAECHNKVFQRMISHLPEKDVLFIEDDVQISQKFKDQFILTFDSLKAIYGNFSLSPIWIPEKKCHYTPIQGTISHRLNEITVKTQRYIDGNFAVPAPVLSIFKKEPLRFPVKKSTSGIGPVLSRLMYRKNYKMFVAIPSMLGHGNHESLQFPQGRKRVPLIAKI